MCVWWGSGLRRNDDLPSVPMPKPECGLGRHWQVFSGLQRVWKRPSRCGPSPPKGLVEVEGVKTWEALPNPSPVRSPVWLVTGGDEGACPACSSLPSLSQAWQSLVLFSVQEAYATGGQGLQPDCCGLCSKNQCSSKRGRGTTDQGERGLPMSVCVYVRGR